jgi:hypothetical protein
MAKRIAAACVSLALGLSAMAGPMDTYLTREGKIPGLGQLELTLKSDFTEMRDVVEAFRDTDVDLWTTTLSARFGLTSELSLGVHAPYVQREPDVGESQAGAGDVRVAAELMAFHDAFDFPYIMPYAEFVFPTGDEDKGLGAGEESVVFGAVVGTTVAEVWHYAADVAYNVRQDEENVASLGLSLKRDLNRRCSLLAEGLFVEKQPGETSNTKIVLGGLLYRPADRWLLGFHGGKQLTDYEDVIAGLRLSYLFE